MILITTKQKVMKGIFLLLFFFFCFEVGSFAAKKELIPTYSATDKKCYLSIVIDDFGYNGEGTEDILSLPIPVTAALMPFSPYTEEDYQKIIAAGKEVIIHLPMEPKVGKASWVGDKGIFLSMSEDEIKQRVEEALTLVPEAVAINNHMGSAIMEDKRALGAILDVVQEHDIMFLDSVTTPNSVANTLCQEKSVDLLKRNVFLDGTNDIETIKNNVRKAAKVALKNGSAIAIGHVGPEGGKVTAQAISQLIDELQSQGIEFITIEQLNKIQHEDSVFLQNDTE